LLAGSTLISSATYPSEEKSDSELESVEESDLNSSSADENNLVQPAK